MSSIASYNISYSRRCRRLWQNNKFGSRLLTCQSKRYLSSCKQSRDDVSQMYEVCEQTVSSSTSSNNKTSRKGRVLYRPTFNNNGWERIATPTTSTTSLSSLFNSYKDKDMTNIQNLPFIHHFFPARYPYSVCPSYGRYASYCFMGSVAGSSAMVLSTQALLIAVGVGTHSAAPLAGALNWVMKDGIGQLGGVIFASQLGKGGIDFDYRLRKFGWLYSSQNKAKKKRGNFQRGTADSNPKRWRMVAALALDLSTLLEICTPMMGSQWFLPCASVANIGKNVGFLAASASRAAIHQSLSMGRTTISDDGADKPSKDSKDEKEDASSSKSSNLGDITAKSGSQTIVASLLGTAIGIFLSRTFCVDHGTAGILTGFIVLSVIHQVSTYQAVKSVPLRSLDRHRLHILLSHYISENCDQIINSSKSNKIDMECSQKIMTPKLVAERESFIPLLPPDDSVKWLSIGDSLIDICPNGLNELQQIILPVSTNDIGESGYEKYILKLTKVNENVIAQLTFFDEASDTDILRGMVHVYLSYELALREQVIDTAHSHSIMNSQMPAFIEQLQEAGWSRKGTTVECASSHRLKIQKVTTPEVN